MYDQGKNDEYGVIVQQIIPWKKTIYICKNLTELYKKLNTLQDLVWFGFLVLNAIFNNISVAVSVIGGGNRSTEENHRPCKIGNRIKWMISLLIEVQGRYWEGIEVFRKKICHFLSSLFSFPSTMLILSCRINFVLQPRM